MAIVREATNPATDLHVNSASHRISGTISNTSDAVTLDVGGCEAISVMISGTYNGTNVAFQGSNDNGTTWANTTLVNMANGTNVQTSVNATNATGLWQGDISAYDRFRCRRLSHTSGTATITISASAWKRR